MKNILLIRFSSIGDIVLTSPVVRCLKAQCPTTKLHYLTKKSFASIVTPNPFIDEVHLWSEENTALIKELKSIHFDVVIDLHKNLRTSILKSKLKVKSHTFPKLNVQKWLYVNFKANTMPDVHIVDRYFEAVAPLNVQNDQKGLEVFIPKEEKIEVTTFFKGSPYVAVAVGAQFATKRLPTLKLVEILKQIPHPIVLLGGPTDIAVGKEIVRSLNREDVINKCGEFSLLQSASVVEQAKVILTHDTGLMHFASAFDTKIVSVWGNTSPQLGMYPYRPNNSSSYVVHEVENLNCRPCSKIGYKACPKKHFDCMEKQNVATIVDSVNTYFEEALNK